MKHNNFALSDLQHQITCCFGWRVFQNKGDNHQPVHREICKLTSFTVNPILLRSARDYIL